MKYQGFRKDNPDSLLPHFKQYGKDCNGDWFGCPQEGFIANLSAHEVIEREDGTITVSPSILVSNMDGQWHGYLRAGTWETC